MIDNELIQVSDLAGEGYIPLIHYDKWRVAVLNYCEELLPENIHALQRHDETDEVFVLLSGQCVLFISGREDSIGTIQAQPMEPIKLYNIKKGTWHSHTLSCDASVLIIENDNTSDEINSPSIELSDEQKNELMALASTSLKKERAVARP
jgi:ureidoglycolate hydrolase